MDAQPWAAPHAPAKAHRLLINQLGAWGYRPDTDKVRALVDLLVLAAIADGAGAGARRISLHLADQDQRALILVLSHHGGHAPDDGALLHALAAVGVASCGTDTDPADGGGRRRWALIDL